MPYTQRLTFHPVLAHIHTCYSRAQKILNCRLPYFGPVEHTSLWKGCNYPILQMRKLRLK